MTPIYKETTIALSLRRRSRSVSGSAAGRSCNYLMWTAAHDPHQPSTPPAYPELSTSRRCLLSTGVRMTSTTQLEPANQHRSVDLTSTTESCLDPVSASEPWADSTVTSEPLCWPAAEASGWAQFVSGDEIGQGNRYTIVRKLGRGMYSSTWLARDNMLVHCQPWYYQRTETN